MPRRILPAALRAVMLRVLALSLLVTVPAVAQRCVPDSAARVREPYVGAMRPDDADADDAGARWARDVRMRFRGTDSVRFVMRRASAEHRAPFDAIEPLYLGRGPATYVGWRMGCGVLMDARGVPRVPMTFSRVEADVRSTTDTVLVRAAQSDSLGEGYRFLLAVRGRIVTVSPRLYRRSYSQSLREMTLLPDGLMVVAAQEQGRVGLMSHRTLREVLEPRYRGAGGLAQVVDGKLADQFLIADDSGALQLFRTNGRRVPLPVFHRVEVMSRWSQLRWPAKFIRVYALADTVRRSCRLYDGRLRPIVEEEIATAREWGWRCQQLSRLINNDTLQYLVFTDPRGLTQSYRVSRRAITRLGRDIEGSAPYVFPDGAMILKRTAPDGATRYVTAGPDGTPFAGAEFTDINILGCGFVWVKRDGKWYSPGSDGSVSERLGYPFSC